MGTEHTEGILEKAVAYMKNMFGAPPYHRHLHSDGRPTTPSTGPEAGLAFDDPMGLDPDAYTFQTVGELHVENRRRAEGE